jgi:hypothetical protein
MSVRMALPLMSGESVFLLEPGHSRRRGLALNLDPRTSVRLRQATQLEA